MWSKVHQFDVISRSNTKRIKIANLLSKRTITLSNSMVSQGLPKITHCINISVENSPTDLLHSITCVFKLKCDINLSCTPARQRLLDQ